MKRYGNLWSKVCERSNIEDAADKALKGKPLTKDRREFIENRETLLDKLEISLISETYSFSPLYSFMVYEPKKREIHCPRFYPDRILHHAVMNITVPLFMKNFTADTYGSIVGRGVALANKKLSNVLRRNKNHYYLQIDIKHFYQSIDHQVAKERIQRVIKCKKTIEMFNRIIDIHDEGMPIGSYTSQYIGNLILSGLDHWVKEVARVKHYFRYMDDMVLVLPDKKDCHLRLAQLREQINLLKLTIKDNVVIAPVSTGIDFIGYKFYPTHTRLRKRIKVKMQRNARSLMKQNASDKVFKRKFASHFGWCKHADCRNLIRKTLSDKLYLFEENMKIKRLSEIKKKNNWFELPKEKRVSIESLLNIDIAFLDYLFVNIRGEEKAVIKFAYADNVEEEHYFITRSDVVKDRIEKDKELLPFIASVKRVKNYTVYE